MLREAGDGARRAGDSQAGTVRRWRGVRRAWRVRADRRDRAVRRRPRAPGQPGDRRPRQGRARWRGPRPLPRPTSASSSRPTRRAATAACSSTSSIAARRSSRATSTGRRTPPSPCREIDPGDGFLMRHGWTVGWCGWQWDVFRSDALLGLDVPQALGEDGKPIDGHRRRRVPAERRRRRPSAGRPDPPAVPGRRPGRSGRRPDRPRVAGRRAHDDPARAVALRPRRATAGPSRTPSTSGWRAASSPATSTRSSTRRTTARSPAAACWRCATSPRSCASPPRLTATRAPAASTAPTATASRRAGGSCATSSRSGLNLDEAGRQVFDGLIPQVAGGRRGQFNQRYAQPSDQSMPSFGHLMPFADDPQTDPLTGESGGLLDRQRAARRRAEGLHDQHLGRVLARRRLAGPHRPGGHPRRRAAGRGPQLPARPAPSTATGPCRWPTRAATRARAAPTASTPSTTSPLTRAALMNLDRWVSEGVEPPPSAFPRLADGTAVTPEEALARFHAIPGAVVADPERRLMVWRTDVGPEAASGVDAGCRPASASGTRTTSRRWTRTATRWPASGCRTLRSRWRPTPAGTRAPPRPAAPGQINLMQGSTFPFAATKAERERARRPAPLDRGAVPRPRRLPGPGPRRRRGAGGAAVPAGRGRRPGRLAGRRAVRRLRGGTGRRRPVAPSRDPSAAEAAMRGRLGLGLDGVVREPALQDPFVGAGSH